MTNNPDKARPAATPTLDEPLSLDKETLKDLEPTLTDSQAVKGGAWPTLAVSCACVTDSFVICPKPR